MVKRGLVLVLAVVLGAGGVAMAAPTQNITVTVTVEYLSLLVSPTSVELGSGTPPRVALNDIKLMDAARKLVVTNDGNITEDFGLRIESTLPAGWTPGTTKDDVDVDRFTLCGRFVASGAAAPVEADYVDGDVLTSTNKWLTTAVPAAGVKDLYFRFHAPTSVTSGSTRTMKLEARCQKTP